MNANIAVGQSLLDMPELLWKAYIDFEIAEEEFDNVRALYARLLERRSTFRAVESVFAMCARACTRAASLRESDPVGVAYYFMQARST